MVHSNTIKSYHVTSIDMTNLNTLLGPDLDTLKGKTARVTPPQVMMEYIQIPKEIEDLDHSMTLVIDIMFVNGLPFLVASRERLN
jgi:hypothetical protein